VVVALGILLATSILTALAQPPGVQVEGSVVSATGDTVALKDGTSLPITEQTRVTQVRSATVADLAPGQYVAIAAAPGPDGVLEASLVAVFPETARGAGEGQREMAEVVFCRPRCQTGDLMTNATITDARVEAVDGGEDLTITFLGDTAQVHITGDTRIETQTAGSLADVTPGTHVLGFLNPQGVAGTIWVYMD
jgi:hypothetical protein